MNEFLEQQNKVIISLLARSTIGVERIEEIVRSRKRKGSPDDFVLAYNALDGLKSGTEIAHIVGITQQGMSAVLQTWEEKGIVYKIENTDRYVGLLKLPVRGQRAPRQKRYTRATKQKLETQTDGAPSVAMPEDNESGNR